MMRCFFALLLLALGTTAHANSDRWPPGWGDAGTTLRSVETSRFDAPDLDRLAAEDAYNEATGKPPRFAVAHPVAISSSQRGQWHIEGDTSVWRYRVQAEGAVSLNFGFRNVRLPAGAQLYVYGTAAAEKGVRDRFQAMGPWDASINRPHGEFWTPMIQSDDAIIELRIPSAARERLSFEIAQVSQGYRGFGSTALGYYQSQIFEGEGKSCRGEDGSSRSGACNMDVACLADDDPWNDPRRAVAAYSRGGTLACTGSLVNNTAGDRRMLFITARHCGLTTGNVASVVAFWNYEWPTCRTPGASGGTAVNPPDPNVASNGETWLSGTVNPFGGGGCTTGSQCSDVNLIELAGTPNPDWNLYWAGWNRSQTGAECGPQGAAGSTDGLCASIHHPGVDEKRITFVQTDFVTGNIAGGQGVHWHSFWHTNPPVVANIPAPQPSSIPPGVTEPGSSGSPLYNADQQLVGVLSGGPAACGATGANLSDFYGKIAHAWEGLGTPTTRIRDYLDPLGTAPVSINGVGNSPFTIEIDPTSVAICATAGQAEIQLQVGADPGFTDPVALVASGQPSGSSTNFSVNPVIAPGSSLLTIGNLGLASGGDFVITVTGTSGEDEVSRNIPFTLSEEAPTTTTLLSPADNSVGLGATPTLSWTPSTVAGSVSYLVEVASDAGFSNIVFSEIVDNDSSVSVMPALQTSTEYWWRVTSSNLCGTAATSTAFKFRTAAAPGECDEEATATTLFFDNVDGGAGGWTTTGSMGASTWTRSTARPFSGSHAWYAQNIPTVSDQRLISPAIALPANENPLTLSFENWRQIEQNGASACYDAGILEVSVDGGEFTQVPASQIIDGGSYRGAISGGFDNPLAGLQGWCDDPARPYEAGQVRVDLGPYAGNNVQLRFRLGTDRSVAKEGWYVDDIRVQSCQIRPDEIFGHGFESLE